MAKTQIGGNQIKDTDIGRADLNVSTTGKAIIRKIIQGANITLSSTGVDSGTGDVTVNADLSAVMLKSIYDSKNMGISLLGIAGIPRFFDFWSPGAAAYRLSGYSLTPPEEPGGIVQARLASSSPWGYGASNAKLNLNAEHFTSEVTLNDANIELDANSSAISFKINGVERLLLDAYALDLKETRLLNPPPVVVVGLDADKLDGQHGTYYAPNSHVGSGGTAHADVSTTVDGFMTAADKVKLNGIATGAEVNVQSDWNAVSGDALILNKPTIGAGGVDILQVQVFS